MPRDRIHYGSISNQEEPHDVYCDCGGYAEHVDDDIEWPDEDDELLEDELDEILEQEGADYDDREGLEDIHAPVRQMPRREPRR